MEQRRHFNAGVPVAHSVFYYAAEAFTTAAIPPFRTDWGAQADRSTVREFSSGSCATFEGAGPAPGDVRVTLSAGGREIARFLARTGFLPDWRLRGARLTDHLF